MGKIFGTDGIRGRYGKEITYSLAYKVGYAMGVITRNNNPILIGRDTRISGEIILEAISRGINASGKECISVGICPTPAIPYLIKKEKFSGGIMISASHNPPEYNGIKIFDSNGRKIIKEFENEIQELIETIDEENLVQKNSFTIQTNEGLLNLYINSLIKTLDGENLGGMKIILDTCYGSSTTCAEEVFNNLGASVKVINNEKNGLKINLGPKEYKLLKFFVENPTRVFSRQRLLDRVWGRGIYVEDRTVDVHIRRLRKALEVENTNNIIRTVRDAGYSLESEN